MVDFNAPYDEGSEDWSAVPGQEPMMASQDAYDEFTAASFSNQAPALVIQTASGANQNLDDDLTEEEREIVRAAA